MINTVQRLAAAACLVALPALAPAAESSTDYVGVDAGSAQQDFRPHYTFANGWTPSTYHNAGSGMALGARVGYEVAVTERFSVAAQAHLGWTAAEWRLTTSEPAQLEEKIGLHYTVGLVPSLQLLPRWRVYGELGIGQGLIAERKSAPTASNYAYESWTGQVTWGAGLLFQATDRLGVYGEFRRTEYSRVSYVSALPGSTAIVEYIADSPRADVMTVGLRYAFN